MWGGDRGGPVLLSLRWNRRHIVVQCSAFIIIDASYSERFFL